MSARQGSGTAPPLPRILQTGPLAVLVGLLLLAIGVLLIVVQVSSSPRAASGVMSAGVGGVGAVGDGSLAGTGTGAAGAAATGAEGGTGSSAAAGGAASGAAAAGRGAVPGSAQQQLLGEVVDASGAPRSGRDPAAQRQVSLAEAASRPQGPIVQSPASSASSAKAALPVDPRAVLGDPKTSGILSNGCAKGYGRADQCVPARAPGNAPQTCAFVLQAFPAGVPVAGPDVLGLDTNRDGWACGAGDAGVPVSGPAAR